MKKHDDPPKQRRSFVTVIRRHPSMAVSIAALVFAMVGTATATQVIDNGASTAKKKKKAKAKPGPRGPAGAQGATGAAGATGPSGFTGRVEVTGTAPYDSVSPKHAEATCPAGKVLIGGGAILASDTLTTPVALKDNGPTSAGSTTWFADAFETTATAENWNIQLSIWCANPTP